MTKFVDPRSLAAAENAVRRLAANAEGHMIRFLEMKEAANCGGL
jgi:hypothetical protein